MDERNEKWSSEHLSRLAYGLASKLTDESVPTNADTAKIIVLSFASLAASISEVAKAIKSGREP